MLVQPQHPAVVMLLIEHDELSDPLLISQNTILSNKKMNNILKFYLLFCCRVDKLSVLEELTAVTLDSESEPFTSRKRGQSLLSLKCWD